jgi:hypothetical protein
MGHCSLFRFITGWKKWRVRWYIIWREDITRPTHENFRRSVGGSFGEQFHLEDKAMVIFIVTTFRLDLCI